MDLSNQETSHSTESGPPADDVLVNTHREERTTSVSSADNNDGSSPNSPERPEPDIITMNSRKRHLTIGTWNVRTLRQPRKLDNLIMEAKRLKYNIMGVSEVHWKDSGNVDREEFTFLYSGAEDHSKGVGFLVDNSVKKSLKGFWPVSERVILIKLQAKPFDMCLIQVYAPRTDHSEEEVEFFL